MDIRAMNDSDIRTSIIWPTDLADWLDKTLYEAKQRREVPRSMSRNQWAISLLQMIKDEGKKNAPGAK